MSQNQFAGWFKINEKEPEFNEKQKEKQEKLENIEQWGGIYKPFNPEEKKENIEEMKKTQQIKENPFSPLIESFFEQWVIDNFQKKEIKEKIQENNNIEDGINNTESIDKKTKKELILSVEFLEKQETKEKCRKNFEKDFWNEIDFLKKENSSWEKELLDFDKWLVDKLWWNYYNLNINWKNKESNYKSLDRAFNKTVNELIYKQQFKRPDTFNDTLNIVKNNYLSFEERFSALKKINIIVNDNQSRWNDKQSKNYKNAKWKEIEKNQNLETKFTNFKESLNKAKEENNIEELKKLILEWEKIKIESEKKWDIFTAWEIDKITEEIKDIIWEEKI